MLAFRKLFLALVVLALAAGVASAQIITPLGCVAQAAGTPSIRAEGVSEGVGDVLINCSGGVPKAFGAQLDQVNIQVFSSPSINITSRLLTGTSPGVNSFSEALLFIDEPTPLNQTLCGSAEFPNSVPANSAQPIIPGVCALVGGSPTSNGIGTYLPAALSAPGTYTCGAATCNYTRGNAFQAHQTTANSLIWQGIPFDPPGTLTTRVLRITNVRVNASQLGVPAAGQASVSLVVSTSASGVGNPIALPITNPAPTVAIAQNSLSFAIADAVTCLQCESANKDFAGDVTKTLQSGNCGIIALNLRYDELFPSVFRRRNQAQPTPAQTGDTPPAPTGQDILGQIYQTESMFFKDGSAATTTPTRWPTSTNGGLVSGITTGTLGLADHGTRLIARFNNIQNGVQVWVPVTAPVNLRQGTGQTGVARLVTTDPNGAGPFSPTPAGSTVANAPAGGIARVSIVGGAGSAVWEIVNADTTAFERVQMGIVFAWVSNTSANLPSLGTATANGSLAPISTAAGASPAGIPIPRFVDTAANRNLITINSCRSNILFPFVSNQGGFDTGLAISNTSKDPFGTALQTGACSVNFYGFVGTSKVCLNFSSPSITGGEYIVWSLSSGGQVNATAGFQGYVIAQCNFQYGHGFAFISDVGAQRLAMGYLALIMDDAKTPSRTGSLSETLGH